MFLKLIIFILIIVNVYSTKNYASELGIKEFCTYDFKHLLINLAKKTPLNPQLQQYELAGWLDLIEINESVSCIEFKNNTQTINTKLHQWFNQYYEHPGAYFFPQLFSQAKAKKAKDQIKKIALLLPFSERYASYSNNIIKYIERLLKATSIKIQSYDTSLTNPIELYQQAIAEKADCVIGPLRKEQINQLSQISKISQQPISIPVLALNPGDDLLSSSKFFKLAKMMDSEVSELINSFDQNNYHRGILLYPQNNSKLKRLASQISAQFIKQYGQWIKITAYKENYSQLIQALLNTQHSVSRYQQLKRVIKNQAEFIPRRRKDIDFIVLLGLAKQIQQLYPLIKYWYADDIPVYTTSSIYSYINSKSSAEISLDLKVDLSGLRFVVPREENKLYAMAKQAVDIVILTNCFRLENVFTAHGKNLSWEFIPEQGLFLYKSR